jgi:hypothetical protein
MPATALIINLGHPQLDFANRICFLLAAHEEGAAILRREMCSADACDGVDY